MRHTHKQEMELRTCVCTASYFCHLFTDPCWGRICFFINNFYFISFYFILSYFYYILFYFIFFFILFYFILFLSFLVVFLLYNFTMFLVVFHLYNELRHTHKQEMELQTCVCISSYFCHLFTDPCWGRTCFFINIFLLYFIFLI